MNQVFLNGQIIPQQNAGLPLNDIGVLRGFGVNDVLRTYNRKPFMLGHHLDRLAASAKHLHLKVPYSKEVLTQAIYDLIESNTTGEASIKVVVTGGPTHDGLNFDPETPTCFILIEELPVMPEHYYTDGICLISDNHQRLVPEAKTLNYLNAIKNIPRKLDAGAYEILYHHNGALREAATSNIFLFHGDTLVTPDAHILKGMTRRVVLDLAKDHFTIQERPVRLVELFAASEVFLTATNKGVLPVVALDGRPVGGGKVGTRSQKLGKLLHEHCYNSVDSIQEE